MSCSCGMNGWFSPPCDECLRAKNLPDESVIRAQREEVSVEVTNRLVRDIAMWLESKARYYSKNEHLGPAYTRLAEQVRTGSWKKDRGNG